MAQGKSVIWTLSALEEKHDILEYWTYRNKSALYSIRLNQEIDDAVDFISLHERVGIEFIENVYRFLVREYQILYEISEKHILIISIWDGRQNPQKLVKRLE